MKILHDNVSVSRNLRDAFPYPYSILDATNFITMVSKQDPKIFLDITYQEHMLVKPVCTV